jgi:hypothetical protein
VLVFLRIALKSKRKVQKSHSSSEEETSKIEKFLMPQDVKLNKKEEKPKEKLNIGPLEYGQQ